MELSSYTKDVTISEQERINIRKDIIKKVEGDEKVGGLLKNGELFKCNGIFVAIVNAGAADFAKELVRRHFAWR